MRLIDADDLRQVLEVFSEKDSLGHTPVQLCDAMPTIDAVEVVRCKDCKWFDGQGCESLSLYRVDIDFFCADGERRDPCSSQDS